LGLNYVYMFGALFWIVCHELECEFGYVVVVCVCETVPKSACLTQASQAHLGEICRDSYPFSA